MLESDEPPATGILPDAPAAHHTPTKEQPLPIVDDATQFPEAVREYQRDQSQWFDDPKWLLKQWESGYVSSGAVLPASLIHLQKTITFPIRNRTGDLLTYTSQDPSSPSRWYNAPDNALPQDVLFGEDRIVRRGSKRKLNKAGGLIVTHRPTDVIRLARADLLAVAHLHQHITPQQIQTITELADAYADRRVLLMLDLDEPGRHEMLRVLQNLSTDTYVRVAWTTKLFDGRFASKKPHQLGDDDINVLRDHWQAH